MRIPRKLYLCWLQGIESAPPIVQVCLNEWRRLNQAWEISVLDRASALRAIGDFPIKLDNFYQPQAITDILRVRLLLDGGVWADATTFPSIPLNDWIDDAVAPSGFFAFKGHRAPLDISNWFLAAEPSNRIVSLWWEEIFRYWGASRRLISFKDSGGFQQNYELDPMMVAPGGEGATYPFFWQMYLFTYLLRTDADFRLLWEQTPPRSGLTAHEVQFGIEMPVFDLAAALRTSPVQKLTWKSDDFAARFLAEFGRLRSALGG